MEVSRVYGPDYAPDYSPQRRRTPPPSPLLMADSIDDMENFIGMFKARVDSVIHLRAPSATQRVLHQCPHGAMRCSKAIAAGKPPPPPSSSVPGPSCLRGNALTLQ